MKTLEEYTDIVYHYLQKEFKNLKLFTITSDEVDNNSYENINNIIVYFNDMFFIDIIITEYNEDDDGDTDEDCFEFQLVSEQFGESFVIKNFDNFYVKLKRMISVAKNSNDYPDGNDETNIKYFLHDYPVFNEIDYNDFVDEILKKNNKFYKYIHKELLSDRNNSKYKHLELANNFDLL